MTSRKQGFRQLSCLLFALTLAAALMFSPIAQAYAASPVYYTFTADNISKISASGNKVTITGKAIIGATDKTTKKKTFKLKVNSKTKFTYTVDSKEGETEKMTKKAMFKRLNAKDFVFVSMELNKKSVVSEMSIVDENTKADF